MIEALWDLKWSILVFVAMIGGMLAFCEREERWRLTAPCEEFASMRAQDVPVRCLKDQLR